MLAVNDFVLNELRARNHDIVLPAQFKRPGMGTIYNIKEFFGKEFEIVDLRCNYLTPDELQGFPFVGTNGKVQFAESKLVTMLSTNGDRPKLVILDEFDAAMPSVQVLINNTIKHVEANDTYVFFVKR